MILCDTGPLVALLNSRDPSHGRCVIAARLLPSGPLVTTWPCFTEAMYLLGRDGGYPAQELLWQLRASGGLLLHETNGAETDLMRELMTTYRDVPMDIADASLVAAAQTRNEQRVFTIDRHFYAYRRRDGNSFEVVP